jgi:hypothetical protein
MRHSRLKSRLLVARWATDALPERIKARGVYTSIGPHRAALWTLSESGCRMSLATGVLRLPHDPALSTLLDVWVDVAGKVMSVSWFPSQPWAPPVITALRAGDWMYRLGWRESERTS